VVDAVEPPREEDGVTVIPVYEEVLVVEKRLVLREEVRLTTRREPVPGPDRVTLRRQRVEVDRHPPSDAGVSEG
jgi:stress response protein YsnF